MPKQTGKNGSSSKKTSKVSQGFTASITPSPQGPKLRLEPLPIDTSAHKFDLHQQGEKSEPPAYEHLGDLPHCYGSKKLFLIARDPHWIFAYWDLTWDQFTQAEATAHDHKVFLQVYRAAGDRVQQIHLHPGARDWYINVNEPDTSFYAEIGFYHGDGRFEVISRSGITTTPRDGMSWKTHADFVTIPFHFTFQALFDLIREHMLPGEELAEALARLEADGFPFPFEVFVLRALSGESHDALLDYLQGDLLRRIRMGSMEITELLRRQLAEMRSSGQWVSSFSPEVTSLSSPFGASFGVEQERNFFMHVNAELIIYGGTDPKATVRVAGQEIPLRPDGTFSYHFTFKDGNYHIPIEADSPDGVETRSALLSFMRMSNYSDGVDHTPQPPLSEPFGKV
ncbi:MAG: DUF4912 domain-containing protein [Verrucomicrobiota bacterium]